ncbi:MAG TPA: type III-A CRISPR-associated RAMP protein Csm3 [Pseudothermotoga sp.]|nr:type III-A CRISPR-associated RAMP protein Csm3 [Pseudothermotoga sp.]HOK83198.1 type III-A CRISPR-associated RAMP protein Csm3 [Pseudothermotoga sp.]HPP71076.1 type III-A CRISPR-associated RAMP protein Csm3 [Pseudothermotoga sp.]
MAENGIKPILGKYIITGKIVLKTGTRVGGTDIGISIGGIDNPIIRNPFTGEPYIPGSSLKGKMRSLLERLKKMPLSTFGSGKNAVRRHECTNTNCEICRLFGSSPKTEKDEKVNIPARIIVRDSHLTEESKEALESMETDVPYGEWKMENSLDRITCHAGPRTNERVPAGAEFSFEIVYTVEKENDVETDLKNIITALELIEDDYIGSSGSRGYGKVEFKIDQIILKSEKYYTDEAKILSHDCKNKTLSELKKILPTLKG